jgi:glycosyltransferase involved in cell wall biosynthesis
MYSALILTLNEEKALPDCLRSLGGCDDVVVLDSGSADATAAMAREAGARVFTRPFDTFAGQRNHAQARIPFRHPWVLHLDADERMTPGLDRECRAAAQGTGPDGYRIAPKMMFEGRWIRHCTDFPAFQARFVRAPGFRFVQAGHGQREDPSMRMENMRESYLHDLSVYGRDAWLRKHRGYAAAEALALREPSPDGSIGRLFSGDRLVRRRALKRLSYGLPMRPALRFIYQYGLRGGFLDGRQGLDYCLLLARYEGFVAEETDKLKGRPAPGSQQ